MKKLIRIVLKLLGGLISLVLIILVLLFTYFNYNRDDIARKLLNYTNSITAGEITFKDISLSPLALFPKMSVSMNEVSFFDYNAEERDSIAQAIVTLDKIYLAFDIVDLFSDKIHISGAELKNGHIHFVQYPDSSLNILRALQIIEKTGKLKENAIIKENKNDDKRDIELALDYLILDKIQLNYKDEASQSESDIFINNITTSFYYNKDTVSL